MARGDQEQAGSGCVRSGGDGHGYWLAGEGWVWGNRRKGGSWRAGEAGPTWTSVRRVFEPKHRDARVGGVATPENQGSAPSNRNTSGRDTRGRLVRVRMRFPAQVRTSLPIPGGAPAKGGREGQPEPRPHVLQWGPQVGGSGFPGGPGNGSCPAGSGMMSQTRPTRPTCLHPHLTKGEAETLRD